MTLASLSVSAVVNLLLSLKGSLVVIKEDYTLAAIFLSSGVLLSILLPYLGLGLGAILFLLGVLFYVQTGRVRFCFDGTCGIAIS
eukprot:6015460-Amphidinium_carterae.1